MPGSEAACRQTHLCPKKVPQKLTTPNWGEGKPERGGCERRGWAPSWCTGGGKILIAIARSCVLATLFQCTAIQRRLFKELNLGKTGYSRVFMGCLLLLLLPPQSPLPPPAPPLLPIASTWLLPISTLFHHQSSWQPPQLAFTKLLPLASTIVCCRATSSPISQSEAVTRLFC